MPFYVLGCIVKLQIHIYVHFMNLYKYPMGVPRFRWRGRNFHKGQVLEYLLGQSFFIFLMEKLHNQVFNQLNKDTRLSL